MIFAVVFTFIAVLLVIKAGIVVPHQSAFIVERLGRYTQTLTPGFHFIMPFVDIVRYRFTLNETTMNFPSTTFKSKDEQLVSITARLDSRIVVPEKAAYGVADYNAALQEVTTTVLRNLVETYSARELTTARTELLTAASVELKKVTAPWGIEITKLDIAECKQL